VCSYADSAIMTDFDASECNIKERLNDFNDSKIYEAEETEDFIL